MAEGEEIELDYDDVVAIVNESKTRLKNATYKHCGSSIDLYQFSNKETRGWKPGHIFLANSTEDLSFNKVIEGDISARDGINKREAFFLVHAPNTQESVHNMMVRSPRMKHVGVLKPYIAGYNTQISQVVSGFSVPTSSLAAWLSKLPVEGPYIPIKVQQLIRIGYLSIDRIWRAGSTSDQLSDINNYHMIGSNLKINPMCTRSKRTDETDMMPLRRAFGRMIDENICSIWSDGELKDFVELLGNPEAREPKDILEHPVLLLPARREIMYHTFDRSKDSFTDDQKNWLSAHVDPGWKAYAARTDDTLESIISFQEEQDKNRAVEEQAGGWQQAGGQQAGWLQQAGGWQQAGGQQAGGWQQAGGQQAGGWQQAGGQQAGGQQAMGFSTDFFGALHFASVTTSHYLKHYKKVLAKENKGTWRGQIKGRVDLLLKKVLPQLLSRCYSAKYVLPPPEQAQA